MDLSSILGVAGGIAGNIALPGIGGAVGSTAGKALGGAVSKKGGSGGKSGSTAGLSAGLGLLQEIQAANLKKKANQAFPDLVDPNQAAFLAELGQKRKSIDTGADFAAGMGAIDTTNAGTNDAIVKSTGGDVGGTIQGLLQSERAAGDSKNAVLAQGQQQQTQYNAMYENMLNQISAKKMQLQLARSQQYRAEWAKMKQQANQNLLAGIGRGMSGNQPSAQSQPQSTQSAPGSYQPGIYTDLLNLQKNIGTMNQSPIGDASLVLPGNIS
jgi:hypothetical protein